MNYAIGIWKNVAHVPRPLLQLAELGIGLGMYVGELPNLEYGTMLVKFQKHSTVAFPVLVWLFCHLDCLGPRPRAKPSVDHFQYRTLDWKWYIHVQMRNATRPGNGTMVHVVLQPKLE